MKTTRNQIIIAVALACVAFATTVARAAPTRFHGATNKSISGSEAKEINRTLMNGNEMQTNDEKLIAIDILLEPDQTMIDKANAINARLRGNFPSGYALDATHAPHVTLLQRFVRLRTLTR